MAVFRVIAVVTHHEEATGGHNDWFVGFGFVTSGLNIVAFGVAASDVREHSEIVGWHFFYIGRLVQKLSVDVNSLAGLHSNDVAG